MTEISTGGPAFPTDTAHQSGPNTWHEEGMTLRDYFAAKALPAVYKDACKCARVDGCVDGWRNGVAAEAYAIADAMLKARINDLRSSS